jgi:hypothetical protein
VKVTRLRSPGWSETRWKPRNSLTGLVTLAPSVRV